MSPLDGRVESKRWRADQHRSGTQINTPDLAHTTNHRAMSASGTPGLFPQNTLLDFGVTSAVIT